MRVLIADDHPLVTDALTGYLKQINPDAEVVAAQTLDQALERLAEEASIDLVVLDLYMPGMQGLEGLTTVRSRYPDIPVVMISGIADRRQIMEALERGAVGFIPKELASAALIKALELVLAGEIYVPSTLIPGRGLREDSAGYGRAAAVEEGSPFSELTARERQVLALLLKGYSNKQIAQELGTKEITAAFHLRGVFRKLGVSNRTQAAAVAFRSGWHGGDIT